MRTLAPAAIIALLAGVVVGCQAPRDLDLDRRIEDELHKRSQVAAAPPAAAEAAPEGEAEPTSAGGKVAAAAPAEDNIELRTYSDAEIQAILGKIPGSGPALRVDLKTSEGLIRCTVDAQAAPQTTANFLALATGQRPWRDPDTKQIVNAPFYDGLPFHRTIQDFIIQTGNPSVGGAKGPGWTIPREPGLKVAFDKPGAMGMVDAADDTHGSQFFITLKPAAHLAGRYVPFGSCGSLDVVTKIANADKLPGEAGKKPTKPKNAVRIEKVVVTRGAAD